MECLHNVQNVGELVEDLVKASQRHRTVAPEFACEGLKRRQPEKDKILFLEIYVTVEFLDGATSVPKSVHRLVLEKV